jgi:hypothetical protein
MNKPAEATLAEHFVLCEETYRILVEENRILKQTSQPPDRDFLNAKRALLLRFEVSNRALAEADRAEARRSRATIEKSHQLVMKTLLLDRENEQLLFKCALDSKPKVKQGFSSIDTQRLYQQSAAQREEDRALPVSCN